MSIAIKPSAKCPCGISYPDRCPNFNTIGNCGVAPIDDLLLEVGASAKQKTEDQLETLIQESGNKYLYTPKPELRTLLDPWCLLQDQDTKAETTGDGDGVGDGDETERLEAKSVGKLMEFDHLVTPQLLASAELKSALTEMEASMHVIAHGQQMMAAALAKLKATVDIKSLRAARALAHPLLEAEAQAALKCLAAVPDVLSTPLSRKRLRATASE